MYSSSQTGRAHLLLISETPGREGGALGIVTLEGLFLSSFFLSPLNADDAMLQMSLRYAVLSYGILIIINPPS